MRGPLTNARLLLASAALFAFAALAPADDLAPAKPEAVGLSADKLKKLDERFARAVEDRQVAGAVVLVARKGKVGHLHAVGRADVEANRPMTTDALFHLASMTKPVTSVAAMMLVEEGKLRLDDPVSKLLPEFKNPKVLVPTRGGKDGDFSLVPSEREVTVRDLLTHTSGLIYVFPGMKGPLVAQYEKAGVYIGLGPTKLTLPENMKRLAALPLSHQPGKAFTYGLNTDVLGRVVEVASGKDLEAFFQERLFRPLGMGDTSFVVPKEKAGRLAVLYRREEAGKLVRAEGWAPAENYYSGGAALTGTASDYARFLQMLLNGGESGGRRLLKAETVKQMTTNQIGDLTLDMGGVHGDGFGLGFGVWTPRGKAAGPMSVGSYSWAGAFYTYFWADPSKELAAVMMTQAFTTDNRQLWKDFAKLTYEAMAD